MMVPFLRPCTVAGPADYLIFKRWLAPQELLAAQGIPVYGSAVPWVVEAEADGDHDDRTRRVRPVSSFQLPVDGRSRNQVCF